MFRVKLLGTVLFTLLAFAFVVEAASHHYRDDCIEKNRKEVYLSSIKACRSAEAFGRAFASFQPLAYAQTLNELGLAELMLHHFVDAQSHLADALKLYDSH